MSFILDALRKSDNERQRSAVPGISDVPVVVQRHTVPKWTMGVIAGLMATLVIMAWAWLRDSTPGDAETGAVATLPVPTANAGSTTPGQVRSLSREARQSAPAPAASAAAVPRPVAPEPEPDVIDGTVLTTAEFQASGGVLPELNLELHVFSDSPAERFVFINSAKYREGETLPEGPRLLSIREDGVVLGYQSRNLLLPRE